MNKLKFENTYYKEALDYSQQFTKIKKDGYYKVDLLDKIDRVETQQNNTIIALLTSIHYKLTILENKLLSIEQNLSETTSNQNWKEALENFNKDLNKLSTEHIVSQRQPKTYSFLTYQEAPK